ncbi:16S rRNA (guanine(527)-N(7))-methyltransferase RsmG [Sphingomonas rubra]|uniref:Ribosomal RNA small subunit methyltransferase G n=1 Tax=Sphingomonas rubra TaxID=634430 RepID=A0A1I5REA9_9SPHN|nr:16S rRNA (guanine(527)-N(7))-methyltransferase RsmG [Sphingomonas rubra]SFP56651.1 16S rRNA (guanine527-N7)-methyltransferase [Sphingomonas rubra]
MTEEEALAWTTERFDETVVERLRTFAAMVIAENERQNLISPASIPAIWSRHIVDSLQLLPLAPDKGTWMDIGTGGGFPGMVVAIARAAPIILVEPRRKRATFLDECAAALDLSHVRVETSKVERVEASAAVISARAVASVENLLRAAMHCATPATRWLLPRGSIDRAELSVAAAAQRMVFHVEQSLTHAGSSIVVLEAR